jgi:hypothetical protein
MKQLFTLLITILILSTLSGQKLSVGSEVGIISSQSLRYNLENIENRRNTYYAGINVNYSFNERFEISSGLHYLRQGYRYKTCYNFEEGVKNELVGKIDYLMVPIAFNMSWGKSKRFFTSIGFYGGYNIKAFNDFPEPIGGCMIAYQEDLSFIYKDFMLGGMVGAGYKILDTESYQLNSTVKYYQGLSNTSENPFEYIHLENRFSSFLLTLQFNYKIARH